MKQSFSNLEHKKFKDFFKIKERESHIEKEFYKKTYKYINIIKWLPWLLLIWIWNSISMNAWKKWSDIDLFIVTTPNSMWLNRIIITFIFSILWVRKTKKKHASRFCLSFFATTNWLNFNDWKIQNDIYLYFWIVYFKPILDYNNTYLLFLKENSSWASFDNYKDIIDNNKQYINFQNENKKDYSNSKILLFLDNIIKNIFIKKTMKHYKKIWKPYWVIINDNLLKFHNSDIRKEISEKLS